MSSSEERVEEALRRLETLGLVRRWWCNDCQDHVPYRCLEMTEAASRAEHNGAKHK